MSRYAVLSTFLIAAPCLGHEQATPAESRLLDVQISVLEEPPDFFAEVRHAEARYIPVQLKQTLQNAGVWGVVRVVPVARQADLTISGALRVSHGGELRIEIDAVDATGKVWLDEDYRGKPDASIYLDPNATEDPFHEIYADVAKDLYDRYRKLKTDDIARIREVSKLRFAADVAPYAFGDYLAVDGKDRVTVLRLPSHDDPMMQRIELVLGRDRVFVDTVDAYYAKLHSSMQEPYRGWRSQDYWQREAMKKGPPTATRSGGRNAPMGVLIPRGGVPKAPWSRGGGGAEDCVTPGILTGPLDGRACLDPPPPSDEERRKTHLDILRELGQSLAAEVAPVVVEVENRVVSLSGSVEAQYAAWRALLKEIFAAETGLPE